MAPVGIGPASAALSNAMVNGYGALSPGDLETVIAYGAANGSGNSSLSNNPATTNGTAALITFIQQNSIGGTGATNINVSGVLSGGSGVTTTIPAAFSAAGSNYMAQVAATVTNGLHWGGLYDASGTATASTNGYPWGSLYDLSGAGATAANHATNGFPWGTLYDAAGAGTIAANHATNGYPWGTLYDAAGAAAAAAQAATNGYPWGTVATTANNSYTTNFFFPSYQTNLVFVLPSISTNYLVNGKLFIVSRSANPLGINIASGATIPVSVCWGQTYSCPPFVLMQSVDGTAFDFGMGGDNSVSFVATNGAPYTLTATQMTNAFSMRAVFDWTVHK
jgi:hypothetical protein